MIPHTMHHAPCTAPYPPCTMHHTHRAPYTTHHAPCTAPYPPCTMHHTLCTMHHAFANKLERIACLPSAECVCYLELPCTPGRPGLTCCARLPGAPVRLLGRSARLLGATDRAHRPGLRFRLGGLCLWVPFGGEGEASVQCLLV
jgi:hypothetical protein